MKKITIYAPEGPKVYLAVPTYGITDGVLTFVGNDPVSGVPMEIRTSLPFFLEDKPPVSNVVDAAG